jgi:hypothetical protein
MNKQIQWLFIILACAGVMRVDARTISTPLPGYLGYPALHVHYPVDDLDWVPNRGEIDAQFGMMPYYRSMTDAFGPTTNECNPCAQTGTSSKIESISALIFGADTFTLAQAFANSTVGVSIPTNPFVAISQISPQYDGREVGVFFNLTLGKRFGCDQQWRTGVRITVPYRDILFEETPCSQITGETLDDVFRQRQETVAIPGGGFTTNVAWAARLDFLSALDAVGFGVSGNTVPMVIYSDPNSSGHITINEQDVSTGAFAAPINGTPAIPFVEAIESVNGSAPESVRWADYPENGSTVINANGTGLANLQRGFFSGSTIYTPLGSNEAQQAQLWIVPSLDNTGAIDGTAEIIFTAIQTAAANLQSGVGEFLTASGIDLCNGRRKGAGDLDFEFYAGHHCEYGFGELQLGVRVPTGRKVKNPLQVVAQPLGNNGHVELRPGIVFGSSYLEWMLIKLDATYSFVLNKTEMLPAPFTGATIANLGPAVPGKVSWQYFWADLDLTFVNPCTPTLGATVAYQPYVKLRDKICLQCPVALDFLGNPQTLDASILTKNTKRVAHTIRTEIFYNSACYNIFIGFAQVIAGHNVTRDTDIYLGGVVTW